MSMQPENDDQAGDFSQAPARILSGSRHTKRTRGANNPASLQAFSVDLALAQLNNLLD